MIEKIFYSVIITLGIVIAVVLLGYILVPCLSLNQVLTAESARYVFSAVAQSLAAIFALTFVVIGWISSLTAKDLARHVFKFVFSLKATWVTIFLFVVSIVLNLVYLGLTDETIIGYSSFAHYSYGLFVSILLFIISIYFLFLYALKTYSVSVAPFEYFYDVVYDSIIPSLKSLKRFLNLQLPLEDLLNNKELEYSIKELFEGRFYIEHEGGDGYILAYKAKYITRVLELINQEPGTERKIYYLVGIGEKIQKGRSIFAIESNNSINQKKVTRLLRKAAVVGKWKPGWVSGFKYIDPLYGIIGEQLTNVSELKYSVYKLQELGEYYISSGSYLIESVGKNWKGFYEFSFLSYWFDDYYELIKEACIATGRMRKDGEILEEKDEPDFYVSAGLQRFISFLYRENQETYFRKVLSIIYKYSKFKADIDNNLIENIYFKQLEYLVEKISWAAGKEAQSPQFVVKLEVYVNYIVKEYLRTFKELLINNPTSYNVIFTKYNFLYKHFAKDIEERRHEKEFSSQDLEALERIKILLLSMLFVMMVFMLKKVHEEIIPNDIYIAFSRRFFGKYQGVYVNDEHWAGSLIKFEKILDCSYGLLNKDLGWFGHLMEKEDIYDDSKPHPDTMVRDLEYCYYAFIFTLCLSEFSIKLDNSYWYPDNIKTLRHFYKSLMEIIIADSVLKEILIAYCDDNLDKLKEILDKLEDLFGERNA